MFFFLLDLPLLASLLSGCVCFVHDGEIRLHPTSTPQKKFRTSCDLSISYSSERRSLPCGGHLIELYGELHVIEEVLILVPFIRAASSWGSCVYSKLPSIYPDFVSSDHSG